MCQLQTSAHEIHVRHCVRHVLLQLVPIYRNMLLSSAFTTLSTRVGWIPHVGFVKRGYLRTVFLRLGLAGVGSCLTGEVPVSQGRFLLPMDDMMSS